MPFGLRKQVDATYSQNMGSASKIHLSAHLPATQVSCKQRTHEIVDESVIPSTQMYALKRRLLAPSWWILGTLLSHGGKEAWHEHLASRHMGRVIAAPAQINSKNILVLLTIWHEIISQLILKKEDQGQLRFDLSPFLCGTQKDNQEICHQVEHIWSSPLKLFEVRNSSRPSHSSTMSKFGSLSFTRHAQVLHDVDGVWLTLNLSQSFKDICLPLELSQAQNMSHSLISFSPIVLRSIGLRASTKKILNYLFLEYSKHLDGNKESQWNSFGLESKQVLGFHKEILSNASSWYDHGVLGWNNSAPNMKISQMKSQQGAQASTGGMVFCWPTSHQAEQAQKLEVSLSEKMVRFDVHTVPHESPFQARKTLFPEPPRDELQGLREKFMRQRQDQEKRVREPERKRHFVVDEIKPDFVDKPSFQAEAKEVKKRKIFETQTLFDDALLYARAEKKVSPTRVSPSALKRDKPQVEVISDTEFMVLVSEFYESLKPMQKRAFENERRGMSKEQFRSYMLPILQRKKSSLF